MHFSVICTKTIKLTGTITLYDKVCEQSKGRPEQGRDRQKYSRGRSDQVYKVRTEEGWNMDQTEAEMVRKHWKRANYGLKKRVLPEEQQMK